MPEASPLAVARSVSGYPTRSALCRGVSKRGCRCPPRDTAESSGSKLRIVPKSCVEDDDDDDDDDDDVEDDEVNPEDSARFLRRAPLPDEDALLFLAGGGSRRFMAARGIASWLMLRKSWK